MSITIITDTGCDLPQKYLQDNKVELFPLKVHLDNIEYDDQVTIDPKTVLEAMIKGSQPITSQASPQQMKDLFEQLAKEKKAAIYLALSGSLSGTYQTAVMMLEQVKEDYEDVDITIIDTRAVSLGQGLLVMKAIELAENKLSKEEIAETIENYIGRIEHLFTVDNLEYLARGGRISKTSALVGGFLNIKPLLQVAEGKLLPLEKVRGRRKVLRRIVELIGERGDQPDQQTIGISHGNDEKTVAEIKQLIIDKFGTKKFVVNNIGSAVGSHAGPGTIAVFFWNKL